MKGMKIGYIRVSSDDQNPDRQLIDTELDKKFVEIASASTSDRPQLKALMEYIREGDELIVHSLDRLARNLHDLRSIVQILVGKGIHVRFMKENLTFTGNDSPIAMLTLSVMGAFAEFERAILKERQREGIEIAKKKGKYRGGRGIKLKPHQVDDIKRLASLGENKTEIARMYNISTKSVYNYIGDVYAKKSQPVNL